MYILDTGVVSNLRKKKPHPHLLSWIDEIGWQDLATTVLTVMEVQIGIERARRSNPAVAQSVEKWLAGLLQAGQPHVLSLDTEAALLLGRMNEANKSKTGADLAIASIAIAHSGVVATGNSDDFLFIHRHFPLPGLYDPFQGKWLVKPEG